MTKVFAVFDIKAALFGSPVVEVSTGAAVRAFSDICRDQRSQLAKHPEDYALYELGSYDSASGLLSSLPQPKHILSASAVIADIAVERAVTEPMLPMEVEA